MLRLLTNCVLEAPVSVYFSLLLIFIAMPAKMGTTHRIMMVSAFFYVQLFCIKFVCLVPRLSLQSFGNKFVTIMSENFCFFSDSAYGYQTTNHASYEDHLQSYYQALSENHINNLNSSASEGTSGPTPPPPDLQPIVDKTAEYVARNSDSFERTVLEKHCGDSRFSFLNPWDQYHAYYQMKKQQFQEKAEQDDKDNKAKSNVQKLNSSGAVSFKLQTKTSKLLAPKVDLSVGGEDEEEEEECGEEEGERGSNEIINNGLEEEVEPPPAKRQRGEEEEEDEEAEEGEGDKIGCKVQVLDCVLVCSFT